VAADRGGAETKAALIRAAEHLMAEHGIEAAQLQDINRLAGQRNKAAVHYHFGDRDGLLRAIGIKHRRINNAARNRMLDKLEAAGRPSLRELVAAYVLPMSASLADESGRDYIVIISEAASRRGSQWLTHPDRAEVDSLERLIALVLDALPGSASARQELAGYMMLSVPALVADIARDINKNNLAARTIRARVERVIDFVTRAMTPEPLTGNGRHRRARSADRPKQ